MFNHGSDYTEIEPSYDEEGNYYAYTTFDVPAGSPLRISYGDPTNPSFLFARYGFLEEDTPATFCKIIPAHINKDMEDLGYAENKMLFFKTGDVSEEVCTSKFLACSFMLLTQYSLCKSYTHLLFCNITTYLDERFGIYSCINT